MKNLLLISILFSFSALSAEVSTVSPDNTNMTSTANNELNQILKDPRVGNQFISVLKTNIESAVAYSFIDRQSVSLHPYNDKIRLFNEVINYTPSLSLETEEGKSVPYRSMVIQQMANCDKQEIVKGQIKLYENYFGEGNLQSTNNFPKRWESTIKGNDSRRLLVIACELPLAK